MKIKDRVYGNFEIKSLFLKELINSPSLQRLKNISQFGIPDKYYHQKNFSRFEHSLGVFILLNELGANLEEQVAGLVHDCSHSAFSHVFDWVVGDPTKEDYQDNALLEFIKNSELPLIFKRNGFDYQRIANHKNFPLLEKEIPDLCADRIDYSLRELALKGEKVYEIFSDLRVKDKEIFFKSTQKAESFAESFLILQKNHWGGEETRARYYILSNVLKEGLKENIISLKDLKNGEDKLVLKKLEKQGNFEIKKNLDLLKKGFFIEKNLEGIVLEKKFRYINPKVLVHDRLVYLSNISDNFNKLLVYEKKNSLNPVKVFIY